MKSSFENVFLKIAEIFMFLDYIILVKKKGEKSMSRMT